LLRFRFAGRCPTLLIIALSELFTDETDGYGRIPAPVRELRTLIQPATGLRGSDALSPRAALRLHGAINMCPVFVY